MTKVWSSGSAEALSSLGRRNWNLALPSILSCRAGDDWEHWWSGAKSLFSPPEQLRGFHVWAIPQWDSWQAGHYVPVPIWWGHISALCAGETGISTAQTSHSGPNQWPSFLVQEPKTSEYALHTLHPSQARLQTLPMPDEKKSQWQQGASPTKWSILPDVLQQLTETSDVPSGRLQWEGKGISIH